MSAYRSSRVELGAVQRRYASPVPAKPMMVFFVVFGLPGVALCTGFHSAPGQVFAGDRGTNQLVGGALLLFAAYLMMLAWRKSSLSITVHENGLVWREKGESVEVPWSELASIRGRHVRRMVASAEVARNHVFRLRTTRGRELVATNMLDDVLDLGERIETALEAKLPELRDALAKKRPLSFGPLTLDVDGVHHEQKVVRWETLSSVEVENGVLKIGDVEVEWSSVPNAKLLLALLADRPGR